MEPGYCLPSGLLSDISFVLTQVTDEKAIPELVSPVAGAIMMQMSQYHNIVVQRATPRYVICNAFH